LSHLERRLSPNVRVAWFRSLRPATDLPFAAGRCLRTPPFSVLGDSTRCRLLEPHASFAIPFTFCPAGATCYRDHSGSVIGPADARLNPAGPTVTCPAVSGARNVAGADNKRRPIKMCPGVTDRALHEHPFGNALNPDSTNCSFARSRTRRFAHHPREDACAPARQ
jgi:hypothetical protein